jgi:hypothetical protein
VPSETVRARQADKARRALSERYRDLGYQLLAEANWLRDTDIHTLAAKPHPVRHLHSGARALEDALDETLMAL